MFNILYKHVCFFVFFALHSAIVLVKLASGNTLAFYYIHKDFTRCDAPHMTNAPRIHLVS